MLRIANNYHSHTCAMYLATRCDISLHSLGPYPLRLGKDPEAKTIVIAGLKARCSLMILGNLDETNILYVNIGATTHGYQEYASE